MDSILFGESMIQQHTDNKCIKVVNGVTCDVNCFKALVFGQFLFIKFYVQSFLGCKLL